MIGLIRAGASSIQGARRSRLGGDLILDLAAKGTFSRTGAVVYPKFWGPEMGVIESFGTGILRQFPDLISPYGRRYLALEGGRTNLAYESTNYGAWAVWSGTPIVTSGQSDPLGTTGAYILGDDDAGLNEAIRLQAIPVTGSTAYTASLWIKKDDIESRFPEIQITEVTGGSGTVAWQFNTKTGQSQVRVTSGFTNVAVGSAVDMGQWWIVYVRFTTTASVTALEYRILPAVSTTLAGPPAVTTTGTFVAWHAQLEVGYWPTSPIFTSGTTATRAADNLVIPAAKVPEWIANGPFGFYVRPGFSSSDLIAAISITQRFFGFSTPNTNVSLSFAAAAGQCRLRAILANGGIQSGIDVAVTFDYGQEMYIEPRPSEGKVLIQGATTGANLLGNGTPWAYPVDGDMKIGYFNVPDPGNSFCGLISDFVRPQTDPYPVRLEAGLHTRALRASFFRDGRVPSAYTADATERQFSPNMVRRIGPDRYYFEPERKNWLEQSHAFDDAEWSKSSVTVTKNNQRDPRGAWTADTLAFVADANANARNGFLGTLDGETWRISVYARVASGTKSFRLSLRQRDGVTLVSSSDLVATTTWQRFTFSANVGTGASTPNLIILNDTAGSAGDLVVAGAQAEKGDGHTESIETAAASVTKPSDASDFGRTPAAMLDEEWEFDFFPGVDSTDIAATQTLWTFGTNQFIQLFQSGGAKIRLWDAGQRAASGALVFSKHDKLTIRVNLQSDSLTISGAASGNGTFTGAGHVWPGGDAGGTLVVGTTAASGGAHGAFSKPRWTQLPHVRLFRYKDGTFSRPLEAFLPLLFQPGDAGLWVPTNVLRQSTLLTPDGLPYFAIEGERKNYMVWSEDVGNAAWSVIGTVTKTGGFTAPDGGADAYRVETPSGLNRTQATVSPINSGVLQAVSFFGKEAGVAGLWQILHWAGADLSARGGAIPTDWTRHSFIRTTASTVETYAVADAADRSGAGGIVAGARDGLYWGMQSEEGAFPSSYIRTAGAGVTRPEDRLFVPPAKIPAEFRTGKWHIYFRPSWSSTENPANSRIFQIGANVFVLYYVVGSGQLQLLINGTPQASRSTSFARGQEMKITVDMRGAGSLTVDGATTGNGTSAFTANPAYTPGDLWVGAYTTVGFACYGLISEPVLEAAA